MKKLFAGMFSALIVLSSATINAGAKESENQDTVGVNNGIISFDTSKALYVHGVLNSNDTEAWQAWQGVHNASLQVSNETNKYFFLPTSADKSKVDIYNAYFEPVILNGTEIKAGETAQISYETDKDYKVTADNTEYTLRFMKSSAEAGIYINNSDADGNGKDLMKYLNADKSLTATATGAIVEPDGSVDNTAIKKIKGRGNTTWTMPKKSYNITYDSGVEIAGMKKSKKYSLLANFQDYSLSRNRFLYDLSDAVGMPYASDSRYVDFYVNGFYWGSYQMCEKIDVGKNSLINDIDDKAYLNEDGTVNKDFPFVCEVDPGANSNDDYFVSCSPYVKVSIKSPELSVGDVGYEEVKAYVKKKCNELYEAACNKSADLSEIADVDSMSKLYLINELSKNWDSGVASTFFTWKQDENGKYKFYGSPVWDYDNSLGNALGTSDELKYFGIDDYTSYTGWWCMKKYSNGYYINSGNIMTCLAQNQSVYEAASKIWFDKFVPALKDFYGETNNGIMKSCKDYYNLVAGSAEMNFQSGWSTKKGTWLTDKSSLIISKYDEENHKLVATGRRNYANNFKGLYDYTTDWMYGRMSWLNEQFYPDNVSKCYNVGDTDLNGYIDVNDITLIQKFLVSATQFGSSQLTTAEVTGDGDIDVNDVTNLQKYLVGLKSTLNKSKYPKNIHSYIAEELDYEDNFYVSINLVNIKNYDEIANEILENYSDCDLYYNSDYRFITGNISKKVILNIANKYLDDVRIFYCDDIESAIYDEDLIADLEKAQDDDKFLVTVNFNRYNYYDEYTVSEDEMRALIKMFTDCDKYNITDDNSVILYATKKDIIELTKGSYYYISYHHAVYNQRSEELEFLDYDETASKFDVVIILNDINMETLTFDEQRDYILNTYFNDTDDYQYSETGAIRVVATREQLLNICENQENVWIYLLGIEYANE